MRQSISYSTPRNVSHNLILRPVISSDLPAILEVYRQCEDFLALGPVATASMEMVNADLRLSQEQNGTFCGIFNQDDEMIGVLDYVASGYKGDPAAAYLALLMIAAPHRSHGLGEAVFAALEQELRRDPRVTVLLAGVQVNNPRAIRFWQRMGFRITSGPIPYPDGSTAFDLRKDL
jgi:ribosomal protein S18 acetylase RimI-like enzyme